jgi:hypothetical protein
MDRAARRAAKAQLVAGILHGSSRELNQQLCLRMKNEQVIWNASARVPALTRLLHLLASGPSL